MKATQTKPTTLPFFMPSLWPVLLVCFSTLISSGLGAQQWTLVWSDEFDYEGLPDPNKWDYEEGFVRNNEEQYYTRARLENARVEGGFLVIEGRKESFPNPGFKPDSSNWKEKPEYAEYTAASLITLGKASWKYGRVEVRAKLPKGQGVWPAIWTLGVNRSEVRWPACGEIDIMEFVGKEPGLIHANVHYAMDGERRSKSGRIEVVEPYEDFHVYAMEWHEDRIDFFFDETKYHTVPLDLAGEGSDNPFRKPHYLLINLALGGTWGGEIDETIFPQKYLIDYVRIYEACEIRQESRGMGSTEAVNRARDMTPENAVTAVTARRSPANPLITFDSSPSLGRNINGPSVIRVPDWVTSPLGKYYMYFAHHSGSHIRLAYADSLEGPWRIHEPGVLPLAEAKPFVLHIASPDVHVHEDQKEIRMYFHGPVEDRPGQWTGVALSTDGLGFKVNGEILGKFYFRVFPWRNAYYAIAKNGNTGWGELYRSADGLSPFESRGNFLRGMRHGAVLQRDGKLLVFYSRVGDAPERILLATVDLERDWVCWQDSEPIEVIRPEMDYEGIAHPVQPSTHGSAIEVRQLRDPGIFEEDGRLYLFYSIAGEMGIAMAELTIEQDG